MFIIWKFYHNFLIECTHVFNFHCKALITEEMKYMMQNFRNKRSVLKCVQNPGSNILINNK